jgi:ubiquitin C-terminal hydrolase
LAKQKDDLSDFVHLDYSYLPDFLLENLCHVFSDPSADTKHLLSHVILLRKVIELGLVDKEDRFGELFEELATAIVGFMFRFNWSPEVQWFGNSKDRACVLSLLLQVLYKRPCLRVAVIIQLAKSFALSDPSDKPYLSYDTRPHGTFAGLRNLGNTCYLNSVLQQLFMVDDFRETVLEREVAEGPDSETLVEFQRLFCRLALSPLAAVAPLDLIKSLRLFDDHPINCNLQQDANEFYSLFMDLLSRLFKSNANCDFITHTFTGSLMCHIRSLEQQFPFERNVEEQFIMIMLDIKHNRNLKDALTHFVKEEVLDREDKYFADEYDKRLRAAKQYEFKTLPNCLVLTLNRFEFDVTSMTRRKLNSHFEFPEKLDLSFLKSKENGNCKLENEEMEKGEVDIVRVEEDRLRVEEDRVRVEEDIVRVGEDIVRVEEDIVRVEEDRVRVEEDIVRVGGERGMMDGEGDDSGMGREMKGDEQTDGHWKVEGGGDGANGMGKETMGDNRLDRRGVDENTNSSNHNCTQNDTSFTLTGVILHSGVADSGHYTSFVFRNNQWFELNDSNVQNRNDNRVI